MLFCVFDGLSRGVGVLLFLLDVVGERDESGLLLCLFDLLVGDLLDSSFLVGEQWCVAFVGIGDVF